MVERPRLFDDLGLVALPTAISCARMFTQYTLTTWGVSPFVLGDALIVARELVSLAVRDTGVLDEDMRWSELDHLNRIVVRLFGFSRHIVIEVWDAAQEPAVLPPDDSTKLPTGLHLVDVTAYRWASTASPRGRLTWAELPVHDRTDSGLPIRRRQPRAVPEQQAPPASVELLRRVRDGLNGL